MLAVRFRKDGKKDVYYSWNTDNTEIRTQSSVLEVYSPVSSQLHPKKQMQRMNEKDFLMIINHIILCEKH